MSTRGSVVPRLYSIRCISMAWLHRYVQVLRKNCVLTLPFSWFCYIHRFFNVSSDVDTFTSLTIFCVLFLSFFIVCDIHHESLMNHVYFIVYSRFTGLNFLSYVLCVNVNVFLDKRLNNFFLETSFQVLPSPNLDEERIQYDS